MALVLVAVIVVIAGEAGVRAIAGPLGPVPGWPSAEMDAKSDQLASFETIDLLILGSSVASFGIDPSSIASDIPSVSSAYNAALPFGSLEIQRLWYEAVIAGDIVSKVVLIEISPSVMLYRSKDDLVSDMVRSRGYRQASDQTSWIIDHSALVQYGPYLRNLTTLAHRLSPFRPPLLLDDGQGLRCESYRLSHELRTLMNEDFTSSQTDPSFLPLRDLERLIETVQADVVALAILPVHDDFFSVHPQMSRQWDESLVKVSSLAADLELNVIDASRLSWPTALFSDPLHLNPAGAQRLSDVLAAELHAIVTDQPMVFLDRAYSGNCEEP